MTSTMSCMDSKIKLLHNALLRALNILVKPADESSKGELNDILELNVQNAMKELKLENFKDMQPLHGIKCNVNANSSVRWKFVCVTLHILLSMKVTLKLLSSVPSESPNKGRPDLLSVSQQKTIRTCLQFVVSMGLLPSLLPGVGIALAARCSSAPSLKDEELLLLEKYERLAAVTRGLLVCAENQVLRQLIVAHHLGDLMAALSQLSFVPLKKPSESTPARGDEFVMTPELWARLQRERSQFRIYYLSFVWEMYPPLVIRELLVLHGAAGLKRLQNCVRTNPPTWLKKSCIILLIHCIMRPKGVSSLIRAICDSDPDTGNDWAKIDTVVSLITTVHTSDPEKYNRNICAQLVEILQAADKPAGAVGQLQLTIALHCIEALYKEKEGLVRRYVLDVILKPLLACCVPPGEPDGEEDSEEEIQSETATEFVERIEEEVREVVETVAAAHGEEIPSKAKRRRHREEPCQCEGPRTVVSEEQLSLCILNMHRLFAETVSGKIEPALPPVSYAIFTPVLFALYRKIYSSPCLYKSKVEELLSRILRNFKSEVFSDVFRSFIFGDENCSDGLLQMNPQLEFCFASGGAVEVREREGPPTRPEFDTTADCIFELLNNADKTGEITTNLFLALLRGFFEPVGDNEEACRIKIPAEGDAERAVIAAQLLTALSESEFVREKISNDPNYLVSYIFFLLEQDVRQLAERPDDGTDEQLFIVLMILSVAVNSSANSPLEGALFESIAEPIKMIRDTVTNEELQHLASQIYNKVVTHGVINESTVESSFPQPLTKKERKKGAKDEKKMSKDEKKVNKGQNKSIKEEKKINKDKKTSKVENIVNKTEKKLNKDEKYTKSAYKEAIRSTYDPLVPVQGHGILELSKLLLDGDEEACRNKDEVFLTFKEGLNHDDSFIYLSSIHGLAALATVNPDTVINTLIDEYTNRGKKRSKELDKWPQMRMKVGEVLTRVTKMLGDTIPLYKDALLNAFLRGAKDADGLIRASSLSNLGTLCSVMKFRIGSVLHEIFLCVQSILRSDPEVEVRRAAVMILTLLLEGLGDDAISVLQDILLDLYRELKKAYVVESDTVLKVHIEQTCEILGKLTIDFMTRPRKLEKRISVLGHPDL